MPAQYSYDRATTRLSFSEPLPFSDAVIHIEADGNFHIAYESTDGSHHSFGNWKEEDSTFYELVARETQMQGAERLLERAR